MILQKDSKIEANLLNAKSILILLNMMLSHLKLSHPNVIVWNILRK